MTYSIDITAPCIYIYKNVIDFSKKIINIACNDSESWILKNQNAVDWKPGYKILGYDEYLINFNFLNDKHFLLLGKNIFDCVSHYATKNLTTIDNFDSCVIRKYSSDPAFLELESPDIDNASRKIISILFLNDVDEGGQINFKNFNISIAPKQGDLLIFPASFSYSFKINRPKNIDNFVIISHFV